MGDELAVSPAAVRSASNKSSGKADDIAGGVSALVRAVDDLMTGGWEGSAAAAFDNAWLDWRVGADQVVQGLRDSADALQMVASEYEAQEARTAADIDSKST